MIIEHCIIFFLNSFSSPFRNNQYFFKCDCYACSKNWPLYSSLPTSVVPIATSTVEQKVVMNEFTKMTKQYRKAFDSVLSGHYEDAVPILREYLSYLDNNVKRPIRDYNDCQEALKQCWSAIANAFSKDKTNKEIEKSRKESSSIMKETSAAWVWDGCESVQYPKSKEQIRRRSSSEPGFPRRSSSQDTENKGSQLFSERILAELYFSLGIVPKNRRRSRSKSRWTKLYVCPTCFRACLLKILNWEGSGADLYGLEQFCNHCTTITIF